MSFPNYIKLNPNDLLGFDGTERHYHLPPFRHLIYTEGIRYMITEYQMHWFITDLAIFLLKVTKKHPDWFYCVILRQPIIDKIELIITNGNDDVPLFKYEYISDLRFVGYDKELKPINEIKLFLQEGQNANGDKNYCLMLPNEY